MDLNIWTESIDWLNIVVNVVIIVLVPLLGVGLLAAGGAALVKTVKAIVGALRFLVDDTGDVLIIKGADLIGVDKAVLVAALKRILDELQNLPEESGAQIVVPSVESVPLSERPC